MAAVLTSQAKHRSEIRDGMHIDWDIEIPLPDGIILRADVFRPIGDAQYPAIMSMGPYSKGMAFQEHFRDKWDRMVEDHPDTISNTSNKYQNWEVVDPEKWVPAGYACIRVDSRGSGTSPGVMNVWSPQEVQDFYECIEWAGTQAWCNGKVGLSGISYYAMNQWQVASLQPPHLAAICVWEGAADFYRDVYRHGGMVNMMPLTWYPRQVLRVQHGVGTRSARSSVTGELVAGPETLSDEELATNRGDLEAEVLAHPLFDDYYKSRNPQWDKVTVPLLSAANWGGQGLHTRGNFEGFMRAASPNKWLEAHGRWHWPHYYTDYGRLLQQRFFDHFLKGEDNGWDQQPRVQLQVRHPGPVFVQRLENEWPLARTQWTKFYLDPEGMELSKAEPTGAATKLDYDTTGDGLTFTWKVEGQPLEITGPSAAKLFLSSKTADADVFLVVRVYDHHGKEVTFNGALDPQTPVGQGWLRASQRKLDPSLSKPWRPYHAHDEKQPLAPGEAYELDVEILPTCIVIPQGYEIRFMLRGKDHHCDGPPVHIPYSAYPFTGVASFKHTHPQDRPASVFATTNTLHFAPGLAPYLLLPVIPGATLPC